MGCRSPNSCELSGSLGGTYQFSEKVFTKVNLSRGFRAPNIAEISSNGVHEGTINYIIGVPQLKPESSLQFDYAVGLNTEHVTGEIALFTSSIDNFIFLSKLESSAGGDSLTNGYSTFKYTAGNAVLSGGEASIDIHPHPLDWMHIKSSFSYVLAKQKGQTDSTKYLPFIPPAKWVSELRMTADKLGKIFADSYFSFTVENYFKQEKVYSAFGTETATPGYILINAGVGADIISKSNAVLFSIHIQANNITDVSYQSHLSRLKYAAFNNVTGRSGVYNMGRNVSLKVIVPFKVRFKLE